MVITGVTVSLTISDKQYGNGGERFVSIRAEEPDITQAANISEIGKVLDSVLDMTHNTYKAVQGTRFSQGELNSEELELLLHKAEKRYAKVKKFLNELGDD